MDRLIVQRTLAGCGLGLALILSGTGCRSLRSEVPPGRTYSGPGAQPPIEFSKSPNPATGPSAMPGAGGGQYGTPAPSTGLYGAPTSNGYAAPGTSTGPAAGSGSGSAGGGGAPPQSGLQPPTQNPFSN